MPHVNVKHFPRTFTDDQRRRIADALTAVVVEHFGTDAGAVSISLEPVGEDAWTQTVGVPEIIGRPQLLIKAPDYLAGMGDRA